MSRRNQRKDREDMEDGEHKSITNIIRKFYHPEFDKSKCEWDEYIEQFERVCRIKGVGGDDRASEEARRDLLLAFIGPQALRAVKPLYFDRSIDRSNYNEIKNSFKQIYKPNVTIFAARFDFERSIRQEGESFLEFANRLKSLCELCKYGQGVDERLRDRFAVGINYPKFEIEIRERWPEGSDERGKTITFDRLFQLAMSMERARVEVSGDKDLTGKSKTEEREEDICMINNRYRGSKQEKGQGINNQDMGSKIEKDQASCWFCGFRREANHRCPARGVECRRCFKKGHFARMCGKIKTRQYTGNSRNSKAKCIGDGNSSQDEESEDEAGDKKSHLESIRTVVSKVKEPRAIIRVKLNGVNCTMEFDSGAGVSIINKHIWNKIGQPDLEEVKGRISGHGKNELRSLGRAKVKVSLDGETQVLPVVVMDVNDTPLFGMPWMRAFKLMLPSQVEVGAVRSDKDKDTVYRSAKLDDVLKENLELFKNELGTAKGVNAQIDLKEGVKPIAFTARRVPFPLKKPVENELKRLEENDIIERVDPGITPIEWATPTVNVNKGNNQVRICGDFRVTLNSNMIPDRHLMPTFEELTTKLVGGEKFSIIDLRDAYLQIVVDPNHRKYLTIATHMGYFQYKRLPFGISSAPAIFQRYMDNLLGDISGVGILLDDIIVTGRNEKEHVARLQKVLQRLKEAGLRVKKEKCQFFKPSVKYLGHLIDNKGIHPTADKIEAIKYTPRPNNVRELRAFLGAINYYERFAPHLHAVCKDLHRLTGSKVQWKWTDLEEEAFKKAKRLITSKDVLVPYDIDKPVKIACDASEAGLGAVMMHVMKDGVSRPVAFASRVLSDCEKRYSSVDREALALMFAVTKFHQYIYGKRFVLETDHRPLERLFGTQRDLSKVANSRLVRWGLRLAAYDYEIQYKAGRENMCADALSRLPISGKEESNQEDLEELREIKVIFNEKVTTFFNKESLKTETKRDGTLKRVMAYVQRGWPIEEKSELKEYEKRKDELEVEDGLITWLGRIVIPKGLRDKTLRAIHSGHPGITAMRSLVRYFVWWPMIDKDIEKFIGRCTPCQENRDNEVEVPLYSWNIPARPWERVHLDFAGPFDGSQWLVAVDACSKWVEVCKMGSITAQALIGRLREWFARFGIPKQIVTDNGPQFISNEFHTFCKNNNIKAITSSPYHPRTNGLAERFVRTFKNRYRSCKKELGEGNLATQAVLFSYRNTPHATTGRSPAEMFLGRRLQTFLDRLKPDRDEVAEKRLWSQKKNHDQKCGYREFQTGEDVWVKKELEHGWKAGIIDSRTGEYSYIVSVGGVLKRKHADQLRRREGAVGDRPKGRESTEGRGEKNQSNKEGRDVIL